jgi:hypothetical protein
MHTINDKVWIVSGVQYMPMVNEDRSFIIKIISVTGASLYPLALSLMLPIFMYVIVLEKEEKLIEMMKMNGMNIKNYWVVTILFFLILEFFTFTIFFLFGYYVLGFAFFTQTSKALMVN